MTIAKWSKDLVTGVSEIDEQHQELIEMVNELHEALSKGKGKDVVKEAVYFLSNYVVEHFMAEEKLMREYNYMGFVAHKREHDHFVVDFTNLTSKYDKTGDTSHFAITVQQSIVQWLVNHIMKVDKEMASFILEHDGGLAA